MTAAEVVVADQIEGDQCLIAHAYRWHEAALSVALLQASGLSPAVLDGQAHSMMPHAGIALGGMRIVVPASQRDEAIAILSAVPEPRASLPIWVKLVFAFLFLWVGALSFANVVPIMSGLYLRRAGVSAPALLDRHQIDTL